MAKRPLKKKVIRGVIRKVLKILDNYPLDGVLSEKQLSALRSHFAMVTHEMSNKEATLFMLLFWQRVVTSGEYNVDNINKLGWDYDNKETEAEQVAFTKILSDYMISPVKPKNLAKLVAFVNSESKFWQKYA